MNNVIMIGLVSFFADLSTEMVYPLIPLYLTTVFGATPALVGVIEGIAESLASLLKVFSGYATDKYRKKKPIAFFGYSTGLVYKMALIFASSWVGILAARVIDRFGKGIRTAPRDVLVSESSDATKLGHSFGLHKALDMAGSAAGILLAFFIMKAGNGAFAFKRIFLFSCVPTLMALFMFLFIKETGKPRESRAPLNVFSGLRHLDSRLKLYLVVVFIFTLGNSSNTFLLLRAGNVGFDSASVVLLYFLYNIVSSLLSIPLGRLSDRVGRKRVLIAGYVTFAIVYSGFAWAPGKATIIAAFALYGVFTAMTAGVERAFIAEIAPAELRGTMLGLHSTIVGIALLPASVMAGLLWNAFGPALPFALGAGLSLAAALMLAFGLPKKAKKPASYSAFPGGDGK
ncbi:MAG TPA: MFS transporter [Rectinemataceae bacterium]|nr:MFS transporter [Rectinemataceae bacterium]